MLSTLGGRVCISTKNHHFWWLVIFLCRSFIWTFFLLGLNMSLPCDGHQCFGWTKEVRGSLCFVIVILPIQVKLVLPSWWKASGIKVISTYFMKLGLWMMGMLMTTNERLTGGNKMGPLLQKSAMQGLSGNRHCGLFHDQICSADPGSGLTLPQSLGLCPTHWKEQLS